MGYSQPEPLRERHSVEGFRCGEEELDAWLRRYARHAEAAGTARTFVTTAGTPDVAGFYALAASRVLPIDATERLMKGVPAPQPVPVVLLARLGVDQGHQRRGIGRSLLQDAMLRSHAAAKGIGARALVVHAMTGQGRAWYERFGFEQSPTDPLHLILLMKDLRKWIDEASERSRPK